MRDLLRGRCSTGGRIGSGEDPRQVFADRSVAHELPQAFGETGPGHPEPQKGLLVRRPTVRGPLECEGHEILRFGGELIDPLPSQPGGVPVIVRSPRPAGMAIGGDPTIWSGGANGDDHVLDFLLVRIRSRWALPRIERLHSADGAEHEDVRTKARTHSRVPCLRAGLVADSHIDVAGQLPMTGRSSEILSFESIVWLRVRV